MAWSANYVPKYRKHRQSGQAVVTLNGRDYLLGPHNTKTSKVEYDRLIAEWLERGRQPMIDDGDGLAVSELAALYWKVCERKYTRGGKPTPTLYRIKAAHRNLLKLYADTLAEQFGPLQLKAVRQAMMQENDWSRGYLNEVTGELVRLFRWGTTEGLVPATVHTALSLVEGIKAGEKPVRETDPVEPVADKVVQQTLAFLPQVPGDMVRLQQLTAARPDEICQLRPCDLDRTGEVWIYTPQSHKTKHHGKQRLIAIGPKGQAILLRYLARDPETYCFRPVDSEAKRRAIAAANRKTPLSCGNTPGRNRKVKPKRVPKDRYRTDSYRRAITRACDKAKVSRWSPNQLRHSAATDIRKRFGLESAQVVLGHSKASTTEIYALRDMEKAVQVAMQVG